MASPIKRLVAAHQKMAIALRIMSEEVESFKDGNVLDYLLMNSVLDYMSRATHLNHHQVEDEIFRRIELADPDAYDELDDILVEHEKLAFLGNALSEAVTNVEMDNELPRMWLVSVAKEYLNAQWRHMRMEERSLFPTARKVLSKQDWKEIGDQILKSSEPDFMQTEKEELELLRQELINWKEAGLNLH